MSTSMWWDTFHGTYGRDNEAERAFLGYLSTNEIPATSAPEMLDVALSACLDFVTRSADEGQEPVFKTPPPPETAEELAARLAQARAEPEEAAAPPASESSAEPVYPPEASTEAAPVPDPPVESSESRYSSRRRGSE